MNKFGAMEKFKVDVSIVEPSEECKHTVVHKF